MTMQNYETIAQPWSQEKRSGEYVPKRRNDPWYYAAHPYNWELVYLTKQVGKAKPKKVPLLLPKLRRIPHVSGVNGARDGGDLTIANANLHKKGWVILDPHQHDYIKIYPAIGGNYHGSKFSRIESLAGQALEMYNDEEFDNFRKDLMISQVLSLPHPQILRKIKLEKQEGLNRLSRNLHLPDVKAKFQHLEQQLKDFELAAANLQKLGVKAYE